MFSQTFIRINWVSLILIFLVVIAGSFVRITGSGMGCPDWPKCFGQWVPPTEVNQLPENYKEHYAEKRGKKIAKFCNFLKGIGFTEVAKQIEVDPSLRVEEDFNARRTWTEYINRVFGFLAGNFVLVIFVWILLKYRRRKLVLLSGINLVLMGVQGWFGSIVVASNLVPWTITIHMLLALVIIALQIALIRNVSPRYQTQVPLMNWMKWLIVGVFAITFYQMFLGTQVRESIDVLTKAGYTRAGYIEQLGIPFFIHRSFSWLVLILMVILFYRNEKDAKVPAIRWSAIILFIELVSGIVLSYLDMPGLVQTLHLLLACILFGILTMLFFRLKSLKKV